MTSTLSAHVLKARMLEREAASTRHALLLEAACEWRKAGALDHAVTLLTDISGHGSHADPLDAAEAQIELGDIACLQGHLHDAVDHYEQVIAGRTRDRLLDLVTHDDRRALLLLCALCGRLRARAFLGLPRDELDRTANDALDLADITNLNDDPDEDRDEDPTEADNRSPHETATESASYNVAPPKARPPRPGPPQAGLSQPRPSQPGRSQPGPSMAGPPMARPANPNGPAVDAPAAPSSAPRPSSPPPSALPLSAPPLSAPPPSAPSPSDPHPLSPHAADPHALDPRVSAPRVSRPPAADPRTVDPRTPEPRTSGARASRARASGAGTPGPRTSDSRVSEPRGVDPRMPVPRTSDSRVPEPHGVDPPVPIPPASDSRDSEPCSVHPRAAVPRASDSSCGGLGGVGVGSGVELVGLEGVGRGGLWRVGAEGVAEEKTTVPAGVYVLPVWRAEALAEARERWPRGPLPASIERHRRDVEHSARLLARDGSRVLLAPVAPERLAVFLKVAELPLTSRTLHAYAHAQHRRGHVLLWPPGRNKPCWCGAPRKYKRCCARTLP